MNNIVRGLFLQGKSASSLVCATSSNLKHLGIITDNN